MKKGFIVIYILCVLSLSAQEVSDYNVVWNSTSENSGGSMPLGNGEMGMNVWVEKNGDIMLYLSRTDAMSELNRIMKIGRVRLSIKPNPFVDGNPFLQQLLLDDGVIEIKSGKKGDISVIRIYFDQERTVSYVTFKSDKEKKITCSVESWRRKPHAITKDKDGSSGESASSWVICGLPDSLYFEESADKFINVKNAIVWCHQNKYSIYDFTMKHQQLEDVKSNFPDPIKDRIFGGYITASNFLCINDSMLQSRTEVKEAVFKIVTHSVQIKAVDQWLKQTESIAKKSSDKEALTSSQKWWCDFWNRSYIFVDVPANKALGYKITQSYITQRFMAACSGRGNLPIRFNGSIFTTDPQILGRNYSPDFRLWGCEYWWQNTRLPYSAMLESADFDLMQPLFRFYLDKLDAFHTLASRYYGAKGVFIPETMTPFGTYSNNDYGWDRTGISSNEVTNMYLRWIWTQSLELSKIMLDYVSYSNDSLFLTEKALPFIHEALLYFYSRFLGKDGKMNIMPTQAVETYWYNVINDMPVVAGLHYIIDAVSKLPSYASTVEQRALWKKIAYSLPPLPMRNTVAGKIFLPAETYLNTLTNVESPELYVVYPYEIVNFTSPDKYAGILTFKNRLNQNNSGWGQDGQMAAILGMTDEATESLKIKISNKNEKYRFPAMWGPNYDWLPDQCHGSNLLMNLQMMVMQSHNDMIYLLPAWNNSWNVSFKLSGLNHSVVQGMFKDGILKYKKLSGSSNIIPMK